MKESTSLEIGLAVARLDTQQKGEDVWECALGSVTASRNCESTSQERYSSLDGKLCSTTLSLVGKRREREPRTPAARW